MLTRDLKCLIQHPAHLERGDYSPLARSEVSTRLTRRDKSPTTITETKGNDSQESAPNYLICITQSIG